MSSKEILTNEDFTIAKNYSINEENILKQELVKFSNKIPRTESTRKAIYFYYVLGYGCTNAAKLAGIHENSVLKSLKKYNIPIRGKKTASEQQVKTILKMYDNKEKYINIEKETGLTRNCIKNIIKRNGKTLRTTSEAHRIYEINEDFFDVIDTEEKAYFLGFLYSDGNNYRNGKTWSLSLNAKDKEILDKLSLLIYKDQDIEKHVRIHDRRHEGKGLEAMLKVHSKYMCKKLTELGCMPTKTFKIKFPEWLDEKLYRHFIRGAMDGDGGIRYCSFKISGTENFVTKIKNIVKEKFNINMAVYPETGCFTAKSVGGRQTITFLDWIYGHSKIKLQRKNLLYLKIIEDRIETNIKAKAGTRGYSKKIIKDYGFLVEVPFDINNSLNEPLLIKSNDSLILGPEQILLTSEYIWFKKYTERNKLLEYVLEYCKEKFNVNNSFVSVLKKLMGYELNKDERPVVYDLSDSLILQYIK